MELGIYCNRNCCHQKDGVCTLEQAPGLNLCSASTDCVYQQENNRISKSTKSAKKREDLPQFYYFN